MIGIDISDRSIKIAEVAGGKFPEFRTVCWSSLSPDLMKKGIVQDVPTLVQEIRQTFTKCSPLPLTHTDAVASIPERHSFVGVLDLPIMSDGETDEAVKWAIRKDLPFDLDKVYLDWQPISGPAGTAMRQVVVGAAQKAVIDPLLLALDGAGLVVKALELEVQAMVRSLLPLDSLSLQGIVICDLGATTTKIIYFDRGSMRFTLDISKGGDSLTQALIDQIGLAEGEAAEKKSVIGVLAREGDDGAIANTIRAALLALLGDVQRAIQGGLLQLSGGSGIQGILLSGGGANLPGIRDVFAEVFPGIPIELGNPLINLVGLRGKSSLSISPQDASHFVTAIGLALRNTGE